MKTTLLQNSHSKGTYISDELRELLKSIGNIRPLVKGTYVFNEGEDSHEIYIVKKGLVQISKMTPEGKELILRICKENDMFGELTLFSEDAKYLLNSKVLSPGEMYVINKEQLELALQTNSKLTLEYLKWTSNHMRKLQMKMRDLLMIGKRGALYSTLIRLSNSYGVDQEDGKLINIPLTNSELAKFCATTRESVNRILNDLRKKGIITIRSNKILLKDIEFLRTGIGCENCPIEICNIN